ncbi:aminopeptidase P family protein [Woeseiaceae bacterium]|nr:aminopeptidase P family protein [Woeseiaceae bacterium]
MKIKYFYVTFVITCVSLISSCGTNTDEEIANLSSMSNDYDVPDVRTQVELKRGIVQKKINEVLLNAMRIHGIDMWIVIDRENNEDPLHDEIGGHYSGVRGAYIFFDRGTQDIEKLFVGSHQQPSTSIPPHVYDMLSYYGYSKDGLTPIIREIVHQRQPQKIGINQSSTLPEADGLTAGLRDFLKEALGVEYADRFTSAELLVRDFRLQKVAMETIVFTDLMKWTDRWMKEGFAMVVPNKTTAADLYWWMEQRAREVRLETGASGSNVARIIREGEQLPLASDHPIEPGDIVSIDSGLKYLGYETDYKRTAYVLKPGESEPPDSIQEAWQTTISISDVYIKEMVPGRVGHEVWAAIVDQVRKRGYRVVGPDAGGRAATDTRLEIGVYGHSVGNNSHDIGARIAQDLPFAYGERVRFPLVEGEFVSVEFHLSTPIPEWDGKTWYSRFEENARLGAQTVEWLIPRQEKLILIQPAGGLKTSL